jgi:hypothetical protein
MKSEHDITRGSIFRARSAGPEKTGTNKKALRSADRQRFFVNGP